MRSQGGSYAWDFTRKVRHNRREQAVSEVLCRRYVVISEAVRLGKAAMRNPNMESKDYKDRAYLSAIEAANYLGTSVDTLHELVKKRVLRTEMAASGQMRFALEDLKQYEASVQSGPARATTELNPVNAITVNGTLQRVFVKNSMDMCDLADETVHLMVTSPPYFDTKMYSREPIAGDLGDIHDVDEWFQRIGQVWQEVYRVLQPGRRAFINIMNLPIRLQNGSFRTLNLMGKTVDVCEKIGFIFKRDIVWYKTNSVRAHFGTYPYPGGILINNMHEFIVEFEKPKRKGSNKYGHLTDQQREESKLDKQFWLSIKKSDV